MVAEMTNLLDPFASNGEGLRGSCKADSG